MRSPSTRTAGVGAVGLSLGTAAAAGLQAPQWVWIVTGIAAGACLVTALGLYLLVDRPAQAAREFAEKNKKRQGDAVPEPNREALIAEELSADPDSRVALRDRLARLHGEGRKLRRGIKPDLSDPWQALTHVGTIFRYPNVPVSAEQEVRRWTERAQNQLTLSAPRFVPQWEGGPSLPHPPFTQINVVTDGRALVRFLDARLGLLENIMDELREGR